MKHENSGHCERCQSIINRYPGFYAPLRYWFEDLQRKHPEAHVSCAGRGRDDQEALLLRKATKAHYGQSAHNYNAALDLFELTGDEQNIYELGWFQKVIKPELLDWMIWYGRPDAPYWELPHLELKGWKDYYLHLVGP